MPFSEFVMHLQIRVLAVHIRCEDPFFVLYKEALVCTVFTLSIRTYTLRKHAYSNILKILSLNTESFQMKNLIFFIFLLKT